MTFPPLLDSVAPLDPARQVSLGKVTVAVDELIPGTFGAGTITIGSGATLESGNFVAGSAGWQINGDGDVEFDNGTFRGTLGDLTVSGTLTMDGTGVIRTSGDNDRLEFSDTGLEVFAGGVSSGLLEWRGSPAGWEMTGDLLYATDTITIANPGSLWIQETSAAGQLKITGNGGPTNLGPELSFWGTVSEVEVGRLGMLDPPGAGTQGLYLEASGGLDFQVGETSRVYINDSGVFVISSDSGLAAEDAANTRIRYASTMNTSADGGIYVDSDDDKLKYRSNGTVYELTGV